MTRSMKGTVNPLQKAGGKAATSSCFPENISGDGWMDGWRKERERESDRVRGEGAGERER